MTDRVQEIEAREQAASPGPWGTRRDLDGTYTIQHGTYITLEAGFGSDGDVAVLAGDDETAYRNSEFIARAREDVRWLLARVAELEADREGAVADEVRRALENVAAEWSAHCPDHSTSDEVSMDCRCDDANELRMRAEGVREDAVVAATGEETHIVADDSDDPEHVDDCPACEDQPSA